MKTHMRSPRKLHKSTSIKFTGTDELGIDAGGLTKEAIERFDTTHLSIYQKKHPGVFEVLEDSYTTIKRIPKTKRERRIIKDFLFTTKFIMLHTGLFPYYTMPHF